MLDRLDDALEPLARAWRQVAWDEMKENAHAGHPPATGGGASARRRTSWASSRGDSRLSKIHLAAHSAGSILLAPLVAAGLLRRRRARIATCTLVGAGLHDGVCSQEYYLPLLQERHIERFALFTLTDAAERDDDCAKIYNKSLLYLVSDAFEARARVPLFRPDGEPILGMARSSRRTPC